MLSSLPNTAKNFARLVILIIVFAIGYTIYTSFKDFFIPKNAALSDKELKQNFINTLNFDYKITDVVDGDTIEIRRIDGEKVEGIEKIVKVRLLGINSPESVDPRRPIECFGKEASEYIKNISLGKIAALEFDTTQGKLDQYNRLLAYVFIKNSGIPPDNVDFINEDMIKNGYAYEYTFNLPYKYQSEFRFMQNVAKSNYIGLWSKNTCNGLKTPISAPPKN